MGGGLDAGKYMAEGALISITASACVIPAAWPIAGEAFKMQGDPGAMFDAGQAWLDSAEQLGQAIEAATRINNSIGSTAWSGPDFDAFTEKTADYIRQMMAAQILAYTTGVAVIIAAITSFISITILTVMAIGLAIHAALILATMATIIGFAGPVEALEAEASIYAIFCEEGLRTLDVATKVTDGVLAAGIGAAMVVDLGFQLATGNTDVLGELAVATVAGIGTITAGMLAKVFNDGVGKGIGRYGGAAATLPKLLTGLGISIPISGVNPVDIATDPIDGSERGD